MIRRFANQVPAALIGLLALGVALGGSAYAAGKISGSQIKRHSITASKIKPNALTGAQIKESTLGTVPRAKSASTATSAGSVGGQQLKSFSITVASGGPTVTEVIAGVKLSATCPGGASQLDVANATHAGAALDATYNNQSTIVHENDSDFTTGDNDAIVSEGDGTGTMLVGDTNGTVTSMVYGFEDNGGNNSNGCRYYGQATSG